MVCGVKCLDCGAPSGDEPLALIIPRKQWLLIHPNDGGYLCAHCMIVRASRLPGAHNFTAILTFGSDHDEGKETPYEWATRRVENEQTG